MAKLSRLKKQGQRVSTSKNEKDVARILQQIFKFATFFYEYPYNIFTDTDNNRLLADIYCQTFNFVIEIDGAHHREIVQYGNTEEDIQKAVEAFRERQRLDSLKDKLCEEAEVKMIHVPTNVWEKFKTDEDKRNYLMELL